MNSEKEVNDNINFTSKDNEFTGQFKIVKDEVPTNINDIFLSKSDFTPFNDNQWDAINSGITSTTLDDSAKKTDIPTKTSDLTNDSSFITLDDVRDDLKTIVQQTIDELNKATTIDGKFNSILSLLTSIIELSNTGTKQ